MSDTTITNTTDTTTALANRLGTEALYLPGWNRDQWIDKNPSNIYHVFVTQEPNNARIDDRLQAVPENRWGHLGEDQVATMTIPGYTWGDEDGEYVNTYIGQYLLIDQMISLNSGTFTGVFRRLPRSAGDCARGAVEAEAL